MNKTLATLLTTFALLSCASLSAQEAIQVAKHPGDVLKFEVKFDCPDAAKVKYVSVTLRLHGTLKPDQPSFSNFVPSGSAVEAVGGTFHPQITITPNAGTGDYLLEVFP